MRDRRRHHVDGVEEEPGGGGVRERRLVLLAPQAPAPGAVTYDVCSALACQVIGPVSPATWKQIASLRPASSGLRVVEGERNRVAPGRTAGRDRTLGIAAECHRPVRAGEDSRAAQMQADADVVEGDGSGAEAYWRALRRIWLPQTVGRTISRNVWSVRLRRARGKCEALIGLRGWIADGVGALHGGGPGGDPVLEDSSGSAIALHPVPAHRSQARYSFLSVPR